MTTASRQDWRDARFSHNGLELAYMECGPVEGPAVVALHGWLDNAASFIPLAARLPAWRFIALDFPGHGHSARRSSQADYAVWRYLDDVHALLAHLGLRRVNLLGHSMGGAVALLFGAVYPERVDRLMLLDSVGPLTVAPAQVPQQMREAFDQLGRLRRGYRNYYADFDAAVAARASKGVSDAAARLLARRGTVQDGKGWYWNLDPRLSLKSPLRLSEEQTRAFIEQLACPVQLIAAPGFWAERRDWFDARLAAFPALKMHMLDGGHHQHMESQAREVARLLADFLGAGGGAGAGPA